MPTGVRPEACPADGFVRVFWVSSALTLTAPTTTQLNAGLELSYYLTVDGWQPTADEQEVTDDRLGDAITYENRGRSRFTLGSIRYVTYPGDADNDEAALALTEDATGWFVERRGLDADTAWAAAQLVTIIPARLGAQVDQAPEANSVLHITQRVYVTGPRVRNVEVVAA
jgi:hypothetical protein